MVRDYCEKNGIKIPNHANVKDLIGLNNALLKMLKNQKKGKYDRLVFAKLEKSPSGSWDRGRHYYSVYYIDENGLNKFWFTPFMDEQNRDTSIPKYLFYSRAIGMSRILDATDGLFYRLSKMGGCYCQIDCI